MGKTEIENPMSADNNVKYAMCKVDYLLTIGTYLTTYLSNKLGTYVLLPSTCVPKKLLLSSIE